MIAGFWRESLGTVCEMLVRLPKLKAKKAASKKRTILLFAFRRAAKGSLMKLLASFISINFLDIAGHFQVNLLFVRMSDRLLEFRIQNSEFRKNAQLESLQNLVKF